MDKRLNILFTATFSSPFIREDLSFLQHHSTVTPVISSGPFTFFRWFPALMNADVTFSWFASVYSSFLVLMTKFLRIRSVVVLGGVDVARMPELGYGIWNSRWKSVIVRYGIVHADIVIAVDESLQLDAMRLAGYDGRNIRIIPTGYDANRWTPNGSKKRLILTVAHCPTMPRALVKGIDFLGEVARAMPEEQFLLIGISDQCASNLQLPTNIEFREAVEQSELLDMYRSASVYFQPSRREGLPNALCEAMLCGCYPVGTDVGGIPKAIGAAGSIVPFGDSAKASAALQQALSVGTHHGARERIAELFPQRQRETKLLDVLRLLTNANT